MLGQIPRPFPSIALVATLLISGVGVAAPPTTARADDCLTAPNSPAPPGSHWYHYVDRATQRKCWYVRSPGQPAQQVAAPAITGPAALLHSTPAPSGPTPLAAGAQMPLSPGGTTPPSPHVKTPSPPVQTSAVKPTPAPARGGTTDKTVQQSAQEENTASTPEVPASQPSTLSETSPQATAPPAVIWPDAPPAVAAVKAQEPIAVPTDAAADLVSDDAERTARRTDPITNPGMPMIVILVLGLAGVGFLSRVVIKNAAARRARTRDDDGAFPIAQEISEDMLVQFCGDYDRILQSLGPHWKPAVSDPGPLPDDDSPFQITQEISQQFCRDCDRMLQSLRPHEKPPRGRTAAGRAHAAGLRLRLPSG
jgi:hypothetical protein